MAELYNVYDNKYLNLCHQSGKFVKIKIELLDWREQAIGEIVTNILNTAGSININYQQGTRRTCNLSIIDKQISYLPNENSPFWYNKKFKVYLGLMADKDIYYWSQGVFLIQNLSFDNICTLNIEGIDKFGLFDGSLNLSKADSEYTYLAGKFTIFNIIQSVLLSDMGNGYATDYVQPIIDFYYLNTIIKSDIVLSNGNFVGEMLIEIANLYGADLYYDTDGHLVFHKSVDYVSPNAYKYLAPQWHFDENNSAFLTQSNSYQLDGHNRVYVYTNSSVAKNYSYTAYNTNPSSPINVSAVGIKSLDDVEIALADDVDDDSCRQYGEYLLSKECRNTVSSDITCSIIPHLDVNKTISITNKQLHYNSELFLINSITLPLGTSNMNINCTNIQCLPDFTCNVTMGGEI